MFSKPRLLTPGPTPLPERVRLAMARDMIHHRTPEFMAVMERVQTGLRRLFGTEQPVLPLAASGTGAMSAAVSALFRPGEKLLVVDGGKFGQRWTEICRTCGMEVVTLSVPWGCTVSPEALAAALDSDSSISGVLVQHSETSTGALHPVHLLAGITRKREVLLVVDGISAVSITPCPMDAWGIDCLLTGSQKGLMLPPGLALIALSERAWAKAATVPVREYYFDLHKERKNNLSGQSAYTIPVGLIVGLDESLRMFEEVGMESVYKKQWALTMMARKGIEALGLELFVKDNFAWGVTSVLLPFGVEAGPLLSYASQQYGVVMAAGQDDLKDSMLRIGHMGWVDFGDIAVGLHAIAGSFAHCGGYLGGRNYLERALDAYWAALSEGYGAAFASEASSSQSLS